MINGAYLPPLQLALQPSLCAVHEVFKKYALSALRFLPPPDEIEPRRLYQFGLAYDVAMPELSDAKRDALVLELRERLYPFCIVETIDNRLTVQFRVIDTNLCLPLEKSRSTFFNERVCP